MSAANASLRLLGSEMHLIVGRRRNQAGILVLAAVPILIAVALKYSSPGRGRGTGFIASATSNGIFVALSALTIELALFLPLAVAVLSGDATITATFAKNETPATITMAVSPADAGSTDPSVGPHTCYAGQIVRII